VQTPLSGTTQQTAIHKKEMFAQAGVFYRSLPESEKKDLVTALSGDLRHVTNDSNKYTMLSYFDKADSDFGARLIQALGADSSRVRTMSAKLSDD
jgi:catalase